MARKFNGFLIILGIILILIIIGGGYYYFVLSSPTSSTQEVILAFNNTIIQANMQPPPGEIIRPMDVQVEGEWAVIEATYVNDLGTPTVGEGTVFIGRFINGQWEIAIPGTDKYESWLDLVPESLLSQELKQFLR